MKDLSLLPLNLQFFAEEGGTEQEVADPAEGAETVDFEEETPASEEGENEQGTADPAEEGAAVQTPEDNARFAAARRAAEAQQRRIDEVYAKRFGNFKNPITGKPIATAQEYIDALDAQEHLQQVQELNEKGIDPQMLSRLIMDNPLMRQAQQMIAANTVRQAEDQIAKDLKAVTAIDPTIKTVSDLSKLDTFPMILDLVKNHNLGLDKAYQLANMDKVLKRQSAAAQQAAINQARGKAHMNPLNGGQQTGGNLREIPATELPIWKEFYPELTMAQLKEKYNSTL